MTRRASRISALTVAVLATGCGILEPEPGQPPTPTPAEVLTLEAAVTELGVRLEDVIRFDAETAAVVRGMGGSAELLLFQRQADGTWMTHGAASSDAPTADDGRAGIVGFLPTDLNWEEFVYGVGPRGVEAVELLGQEEHVAIVEHDTGAWVMALRREVRIDQLRWRLIGADGEVLFDGVGLTPSDQ